MGLRPINIPRKILAYFLVLGVIGLAASYSLLKPSPVHATAGINQQVNFQGRLLNSQGATVPDGIYNIQFKIYQDGDGQSVGDTTGSPTGSLKWTEDYLNNAGKGVVVKNGFLSVQLGSINPFGSNIDWNQDTLWLSMNVGGTAGACTPFTSCSPDGEMTPMKRLSANVYSLNSGLLNGISSTNFVQIAQGVQTDASSSSSIFLNKNNASGNILQFQKSGVDKLVLTNSGNLGLNSGGANLLSINSPTTADVAAQVLIATGGNSSKALVLQRSSGQSANILEIQDSNGNVTAAFNNTGSQLNLGRIAGSGTVTQGQLLLSDGTTDNFGTTLKTATLTTGSQTILIPNTAGAGGTICLQNSASCGFVTGSTASFIQNTTTPQTANVAITSAASSSVAGLFQGASGQSVDIFQVKGNGVTTPYLSVGSAGAVLLQPSTDTTSAFNIKSGTGNNVLTVDTLNTRVGIGLGSNTVPTLTGSGLEVKGALRLSGTSSGFVDTFTTPGGANLTTKINIPYYDPGNFNQVIALGLPSTASSTARAITLADGRTVAHQPTLAVLSPNENQIFGLSYDGSNVVGVVKNSASTIALQGNGVNLITAINNAGAANVGIGNAGLGGYSLDVTGDVNTSTQYRIGGTIICTASGCTPTAGSGNYIQNTTSQQASSNFNISGTGTAATSLLAPLHDTATAVSLNIGTGTASAVNIARSGVATAVGGSLTTGGSINSATISGGSLSGGVFSGGSVSAGTVSGGTLTATAVNGLNVSGTTLAVAAAATALTIDAGTTGNVSIGSVSSGDILLGGGSASTGCTVNNGNGSLACSSTVNGATLSGGTLSGGTVSGGTLTSTAVNSLLVGANAIAVASGNLTIDANTTGTISLGATSTGDILLGGGSASTGCTVINANGNLACTGTINGATISGGTLSGGSFTGGSVSNGTFSGGTVSGGNVSGGTLTASAVNGLNVGTNAITTASGGLTVDSTGTNTVSIGSVSSGDILLGGGSASTGCTVINASGNYVCTGTINGATISGGTLSAGSVTGGTLSAGTFSGGSVSGGSLTTAAVNGLNVSSSAIAVATAATALTIDAGTTGTVSIGGTSTGNVFLAGGQGATGCTINNGNGNLTCDGTINGATFSGGTLSGGTVSGGTLTATAVNSLNVGANAISTASGAFTIDANGVNTISIGNTSTGDILLGGGSASTGCTVANASGNFACTGTVNGATISGGTLTSGSFSGATVTGGTLSAGTFSGGSVSGGSLTATAVNSLNVGANAISTASGAFSLDANGTNSISIGSGSTGDILLGGGSASTGCTVINANGNFVCAGTLNGAVLSGGTLSAGSFTGGSVSGGTFSAGTVSGGSLTATAVNGLNVSSTAVAVAAAATGLTVDAGTTGTVSIGGTSTGNVLLAGGQGATGCTVNNGNGNLNCDGTINGASLTGGSLSGGTVSGGTLTTTAVNSLLVGANAIATSSGNLTIDAVTTSTISLGNTSTGDILLGGGSGSTGCTVTNTNGNFACSGTINGATISGGTLTSGSFSGATVTGGTLSAGIFTGGSVSGGSLAATAVNGLNVGASAISVAAAATNLSVDAGTTGAIALGSGSTGDILLGGGSGSTGCTVTNSTGNYVCTGTINGATISGGTLSAGSVTGGSLSGGTFSAGTVSGGSLTATAVNGLNVSSTAVAVAAAATNLAVDAGTTGTVSIGGTSTGNVLLAGGQGATGCTINNGNGALACDGTINGATISAGTLSGGTVSGGTLTATAVNSLNIGANAISTAAGALTIDATTTSAVSIGNTSTGDILLGGGSAATGCTVTNATGAFVCTSTINGATISGGTVSGGSLTATAVNGLNVSSTAVAVAAAATNLAVDAGTTGTVSVGGTSTGDILLGGGSASSGCTVANASGNFACTGSLTAGTGITATAGSSSLTGAAAGNSNAVKINSGATTNTGLVIQGAASQSANLLSLQDSTGISVQTVDASGNSEQLGNLNTPVGGLGATGNLLTMSQAFDNAVWTRTNVTAPTANTVVAPDSTTSGELLADTAAGGSVSQTSATAPTNANYTFSVWLKAASGTQSVDLRIDGATSGTGTVKTVTTTTTWQRFSVTQNPNGFSGSIKVLIFPGGTGASSSVNAWGAQLVLGSVSQVYTSTVNATASASTGLAINGAALLQSTINSTSAFAFQNSSGFNVLAIDTTNNQLKIYAGAGGANYISLSYNDGTSTGTIAASSGTTAIGSGTGAISVLAGSGSGITITGNAASLWRTTAGSLTLQSGTSSDLILTSGSGIVQVSGSSVTKLGSSAGDPGTCTAGAVVYNTTTNTLRGCQGSTPTWNDLVNITIPTLQQTYTASTGGTTPEVKLATITGTLNSFDIQGDNAATTGSLLNVRAGTASGLGTALLSVSNTGNVTIQSSASVAELSTTLSDVSIGSGNNAQATNPIVLVLNNYQPSTAGAEPTEQDGAMYYDADANQFRCGVNGLWSTCAINSIQSSYVFEDEFLSGTAASASSTNVQSVGNLNWNVNATTSCSVAYNQTGPALAHDHPGTLRLTTSAANGAGCALTQAGTASGTATLSQILGVGDTFKTNIAIGAQTGTVRVGWTNQTSNTTPSSGAYWEYVSGTDATHLRYCYANNGTPTCATGPTITANTWAELEIRINATNNITFITNIGGVTTTNTTSSTFDPGTTNRLGPTSTCYASTVVAQNCYIDYIQWAGYTTSADGIRD